MRRQRSIPYLLGTLGMCAVIGTASCGKVKEKADDDAGLIDAGSPTDANGTDANGNIDAAVTDGGRTACIFGQSNWDGCNWAP